MVWNSLTECVSASGGWLEVQMLLNGYHSHTTGKKNNKSTINQGSFAFFHFISTELCFINGKLTQKGWRPGHCILRPAFFQCHFVSFFKSLNSVVNLINYNMKNRKGILTKIVWIINPKSLYENTCCCGCYCAVSPWLLCFIILLPSGGAFWKVMGPRGGKDLLEETFTGS